MSNLPQLRNYQLAVIEGVREQMKQGHRRILVVVPTGGGKTTIGGSIIHSSVSKGHRVLWLAHRKELVEQAHERISDRHKGFGIPAGVMMAGHPPRRKHAVQVASIATLIRRDLPTAKVVLVDEAHHSVSPSFLNMLDKYPDAVVIGLTATPYRLDGRGLGDVYTAIVAPVSIGDLQAQGYLTPVRYFGTRKDLEPKLDTVKTVGGDYKNDELYKLFDKRALYDGVVANYVKFANASRAIVFNINVEHSLKVMEAFRAAGIAAYHVDGETPRAERESILAAFKRGEFEVLCNVNILTEGFDLPAIETVILNRATKSKSLYLQMVGRGLRPAPGKSACTVIDQGGNVRHFGPVEHPEEHSLEATPKRKSGSGATSAPPMKTCPQCERLDLLFVQQCPECGHVYSSGEMKLEQEEFLELTDFLPKNVVVPGAKKPVPDHLKKSWLDMSKEELKEYATIQGYKPGWVYCQLKRQEQAQEGAMAA
ncbi:DEAD/DEAH box helicase [Hymenobacter saemangeumensis]|uniref:DEAD/DEAH box helicase n=1 Tax=Hymenobacter saemangeumensis TaxID=1084522 RepID=A0ABP8I2Q7_9BACT